MSLADKTVTFEDAVKRLEEIVRHLENGDLSLQDSVCCFEEGNELIKKCSTMLDEAEQKVMLLRKGSNGEAEELPFEQPDNP